MKATSYLTLTLCLAFLGGCEHSNRIGRTQFEPMGDGSYRFSVSESSLLPYTEEGNYLSWLDRYVRDNGLCASGYDVGKPQTITIDDSLSEKMSRRYYFVRCK